METMYCGKCEGAADAVELRDGLCEWCADDVAFVRERGALFTVHDSPAFVGRYTGEKWNGWDVPAFSLTEALSVLRWVESYGHVTRIGLTGQTSGDNIALGWFDNLDGEHYTITPDSDGLFSFDGWTWEALTIHGDVFDNEEWALEAVESRLTFERSRFALIPSDTMASVLFEDFRDELLNAHAVYGDTRRFPSVTQWRDRG